LYERVTPQIQDVGAVDLPPAHDDLLGCPDCRGTGKAMRPDGQPTGATCPKCNGTGLAFSADAAAAILAGRATVPDDAPVWGSLADKLRQEHADATGKHLRRLCECGKHFAVDAPDSDELHCPACRQEDAQAEATEDTPAPYAGGDYVCTGCGAPVSDVDVRPALVDGDDLYCPACAVNRVVSRVQAVPPEGKPRPAITCHACDKAIGPADGFGVQVVAMPTAEDDPVGRGRTIPAVQVRCYDCATKAVVAEVLGGKVAQHMLVPPKYSTQPNED
jgi:hypothetical protein